MIEVDYFVLLLILGPVFLQFRLILLYLFFELLHLKITVPVQVVILFLLLVFLEFAALGTTLPSIFLMLSGLDCDWAEALVGKELVL